MRSLTLNTTRMETQKSRGNSNALLSSYNTSGPVGDRSTWRHQENVTRPLVTINQQSSWWCFISTWWGSTNQLETCSSRRAITRKRWPITCSKYTYPGRHNQSANCQTLPSGNISSVSRESHPSSSESWLPSKPIFQEDPTSCCSKSITTNCRVNKTSRPGARKMSKVRFGTLFLKLDQVTFLYVVYTIGYSFSLRIVTRTAISFFRRVTDLSLM